MISAPYPPDEKQRLAALYKTEILDTPYEAEFTEIVQLASKICKTPISTISLIDTDRQWFKAEVGFGTSGGGRDISFCSHAILGNEPMIVEDAYNDERFFDNPLVLGNPFIRSYAGIPLVTGDGYKIGTLCVIDTKPRSLDDEQIFAISVLANQVMKMIELRMKSRQMQELTEHLKRVSSVTAHDVRNPLQALQSIIDMQAANKLTPEEMQVLFPLVQKQLQSTLNMLDNLVAWGKIESTPQQLEKNMVNLHELVATCVSEVELVNGLKKNVIINHLPVDLHIKADANALSFMLRNLLSNAVKFTTNGSIEICYTPGNHRHTIQVKDTGIGIPDEYIVNAGMFSFKRRDGTGKEKGSGLGLSLVKEQLAKMGGSINFTTIAGKGTAVSISFP